MAKKKGTAQSGGITCAFCKGKGKDPFGIMSPLSVCQVCTGTGKVTVPTPRATCVFCKGTGVYFDERVTCTVCGGKGSVTVPKGAKKCPACKGTGKAPDGLPCLTCKGKGVV